MKGSAENEPSVFQKVDLPWKQLTQARDVARIIGLTTTKEAPLHINLIGNNLACRGTTDLVESLMNEAVEQLNLSCNNISNEGAIALAKFIHENNTLTELVLFGNDIGDEGLRAIALALSQSNLKKINLSYNRIGADGVEFLTSCFGTCSVEKLDLTGNCIGDDGATALAGLLPTTTSLSSLVLSQCGISDLGAITLANSLVNPGTTLRSLRLAENQIGATGAKAIAFSLRHNTSLQVLDIRFNDTMSSSSLLFLDLLMNWNTSLVELDVCNKRGKRLQQQLDYFARLNACGRNLAQRERASKLTPLLFSRVREEPEQLYGLLLQSPHVWLSHYHRRHQRSLAYDTVE